MSRGSQASDLRLRILASIHEILSKMPLGYATSSDVVGKVSATDLEIEGAVKYFEAKGFLNVEWNSAGFFAKITAYGIDELERAELISIEASTKSKQAQSKILGLLFEAYSKDPQSYVTSEKLFPESGFQEIDVLQAAKYLRDKALIELEGFGGGNFIARISASGIDSVEAGQKNKMSVSEDKPIRRRLSPARQKDYVMRAGKCMVCGEKDIRVLDVHHIKPFADGGSNKPSNLSVLCPNCHKKAQKGLIHPPSLAQILTGKVGMRASKSPRRAKATKSIVYCQRCGEIAGSRSECIGLYTAHDFVNGSGVIYCQRCGQKVGGKSECIGLSTSHNFTAGNGSEICIRCGQSIGRKSVCTGLNTNHNFVSK